MVSPSIQTTLFFDSFLQCRGGVWFRPNVCLIISHWWVNSPLWWVCLVPFGECLADFCMGSVFGLRQDKIQIESTCEADCSENQETVGVQTFLWKGRDKKASERQSLDWLQNHLWADFLKYSFPSLDQHFWIKHGMCEAAPIGQGALQMSTWGILTWGTHESASNPGKDEEVAAFIYFENKAYKNESSWGLPWVSPVAKTLSSQCREPRFHAWSGN